MTIKFFLIITYHEICKNNQGNKIKKIRTEFNLVILFEKIKIEFN